MRLLALALLAVSAFAQNNPVTANYPTAIDDTQLGVFADRAYSTLAQAVTSTSTTLTLADASAFPDAEYWVVVCPLSQCGIGASAANGETIFITGKSGNVLTIGATGRQVTAAQTGTATGGSNPTHAIGEAVVLAPVAGQINRWLAELKAVHAAVLGSGGNTSQEGAYSGLSAVTGMATGDIYYFDDSEETQYTHAIYDGSDWVLYYDGYACEPPVLGDFTWDNQGTSTATTVGGAVVITPQAAIAQRALYKTAPATPYTIEIMAMVHYFGSQGEQAGPGLGFRQSSTGELAVLQFRRDRWISQKWNTSSSYNSDYTAVGNQWDHGPYWIRISDDGSNRIISLSRDGFRWNTAHTIGRTDFLTADQVGMTPYHNGNATASMTYLSWKEF